MNNLNSKLEKSIIDFLSENSEETLLTLLENSKYTNLNQPEVLTIIVNAGVHPLQEIHRRGDVFIASNGNIDLSSKESALNEFTEILINVARKLQSSAWKKVYLVPFGPSVLAMQIKLLVQKILDQETVDVLHAGSGVHYDIDINIREIVIKAGKA